MLSRGLLAALLWLLAVEAPAQVLVSQEQVEIRLHRQSDRDLLEAENLDSLAPRHLVLDLIDPDDVLASEPLPVRVVLRPRESREVVSLTRRDPDRTFSYHLDTRIGFGDPEARVDADFVYSLPFGEDTPCRVTQGYDGPYTHQGIKALDFQMDEGTVVRAARDGVVVRVKDDSDRGGLDPSYAEDANYVDILHRDGTWATYVHLQKGGALVRVGQRVSQREEIGRSGATGQVAGPHLHFAVLRATWSGPVTLPTTFETGSGLDF
jgi:murein DD-endopeptidase MepM/ murein hydrolase activator NlpD